MTLHQREGSRPIWKDERARLDGLPAEGGLNIAHEAIDRHVEAGRGDKIAIRWLSKTGNAVDLRFVDLQHDTNRFAGALSRLGYHGGHAVATLLGREVELYISALGTLKSGGVYTPLFSAFGPDPIAMRVQLGQIQIMVTSALLYRRKLVDIRDRMPSLRHILIVGGGAKEFGDPTVLDFDELLSAASDSFTIPATSAEDWALLHFTSGTTGKPKGVVHVHEAAVVHGYTGRSVLDLHRDDVFWCSADPGWVTGTSYGIIAPLINGVTSIVDEAEFDAERWYRTIEKQNVRVFYTAPTALRMLQRAGIELSRKFDLSSLRMVACVGEALDPEMVLWAREVFGVPVLDTWWQTETGGIMIANRLGDEVRPGSMGKPIPGIVAGLLRVDTDGDLVLDDDGKPVEIDDPAEIGELALEAGWPSMFRIYLNNQERYDNAFVGRWYRSGDLARRDRAGFYWFVGRNNDLIKSAGHLIGPFEVESALNEHEAVLEAGVIGKPEPTVGEIVKAFVVIMDGHSPTEVLRRELIGHARKSLGAAVAPREIEFVESLPHTRSGKIMRRLLKARELGLDEGDISTLEMSDS